jgi:mannose-1-phosphate guanylyltransferase/mannose-6-phosphate isomerase
LAAPKAKELEQMKVIILAGGGGTRLWPLSCDDFPKQFLHFGDGISLLQKTVQRFLTAPFIDGIVVATNYRYCALVQTQIDQINEKKQIRIISEPCRRNTAPAIALAVKYLQDSALIGSEEALIVVPSDHFIEPVAALLQYVHEAQSNVHENIVLFGVEPTKPETGYGYIQAQMAEKPFSSVLRFVEKPDIATVQKYIKSRQYYWNTGIFAFCSRIFWEEVQQHARDIFAGMQGDYASCLARFAELPNVSFDRALLEKTNRIVMRPMQLNWSDVGSWDSLYELGLTRVRQM